jgi:cyclic pyranopterin phosphate synthase
MPEEGVVKQSHNTILSLEEIATFVQIAAAHGFKHIRLTGGEPLVRLGIVDLVRDIANTSGIESVAMTTNGVLLPKMALELKEAGLSRVNISLDTLDEAEFARITRCGNLQDVFAGINAALKIGLDPVKLNTVVVRSLRQDFLSFVQLAIEKPLHVRFIEYMPLGESCGIDGLGWSVEDTIPNDELISIIEESLQSADVGKLEPLVAEQAPSGWGPASYYRVIANDGTPSKGTVGFISALSTHFCATCNRIRLTADGKLRACLFSDEEYDVREALRANASASVEETIKQVLNKKPDEHHHRVGTTRNMSAIGG